MMTGSVAQITVRDAAETDVSALTAIKQPDVLHQDRVQEAQGSGFRYLVVLCGPELIGFACLVFRRPASWSSANARPENGCLFLPGAFSTRKSMAT